MACSRGERTSYHSSPGTAFYSETWGGAKQSTKVWRVCEDTSPAEVALKRSRSQVWWESCCNLLDWCNQIRPLPISSKGVSHIHIRTHALCAQGMLHMQWQELKQNGQGKQECETSNAQKIYCLLTLFQFLLESITCLFCLSQWLVLAENASYVIILHRGKVRLAWGWTACSRSV